VYNSVLSILQLKLDINILMLLAVIGSVLMNEWFEAATVITV